jgi:hypothetical protein
MNRAPNWIAAVLGGCGALFNVPALVVGLSCLWKWIEVHSSSGPYFRWPYLEEGLTCVVLSGLGLGFAMRAIWGKRFRVAASVASLFFGLGCAVELPTWDLQPNMAGRNLRILGHADHSLSDWDEAHGRFPTNEDELRKALAVRPLQEPAIYFRRGRPIPYDVQIETNAAGPYEGAVPPNPGTVVYAVSSDYKEYWLTMTTLRNPAVGPVVWEHVAGRFQREPIWVMHRKHHNPGDVYQGFIE